MNGLSLIYRTQTAFFAYMFVYINVYENEELNQNKPYSKRFFIQRPSFKSVPSLPNVYRLKPIANRWIIFERSYM